MKQLLAVHILLLGMLRYHARTASCNASLGGDYSPYSPFLMLLNRA